jgi:hypothetical protein
MAILADQVVTPRNCSLAVGIPSSRESFDRAAAAPYDSFAKGFAIGGWPRYQSEVIEDLGRLFRIAEALGVPVTSSATRILLSGLFRDPGRRIVILASHWDEKKLALELYDGFVSVDEFVAVVDPSFDGILDFCACRPVQLVNSLRVNRPKCLTRYTPRADNTPYIWIAFYGVLLRHLARGDRTYLQALEEVVDAFTKPRISMKSLSIRLHGFLSELGLLAPIKLGGGEVRTFSDDQKRALRRLLAEQQKVTSRLLNLAVVMVAVIFCVGIFFALYYRDKPSMLEVALGGSLFSNLVTVRWIRKLWIEKGLVDLAYLATEEMPADEAIRLASTIYWRLLSGKEHGTANPS